jgi:pilus assembly protein CpaF
MPILDRVNGNNPMPEDDEQPNKDADKGREPHLVSGQLGTRMVSVAALVERIVSAFITEYTDSPALREADNASKRLKLILDTANYILSIESVSLSADEKANVVSRVYSELFGYGPLDALFLDDRVTTIELEGVDKVSVRYGHGDLEKLKPLFDDDAHMQRVIARLLMDAGAELREDQPIIETGLIVGDRPVGLNIVSPPITPQLTTDIRVHPRVLPTLDDLVTSEFLTEQAATLLRGLIASPYGLMIVGDAESGKTTLLSILLQLLEQPESIITVERAGELRLPPGAARLMTQWKTGNQAGVTFGAQINNALEKSLQCLVLDEVRADEPETIAPLLMAIESPRQIWSFRGAAETKRLQSALGMLARRADSSRSEEMVRALYQRLPFVIAVRRFEGRLQLYNIGEWQFIDGADYPNYVALMGRQSGELILTGKKPSRTLNTTGLW